MNTRQRTLHAFVWPILTVGLLGLIVVAWILRTPFVPTPTAAEQAP